MPPPPPSPVPSAGRDHGSDRPIGELRDALRRVKHTVLRARRRRQSAETVFSNIYAGQAWESRGERFFSGSGSDEELSAPYADLIARELAGATADETLVDLGCGDFRVGRRLLEHLPVRYVGVDVVPELVAYNNERFGGDQVAFERLDIAAEALPEGDYCLVRQVLQHLSNAQVASVLPKLRRYKRVFITEHYPADETGVVPNLDKVHGPDVRAPESALYLDRPPFGLRTRELLSVPWASPGSPATVDLIRTLEVFWP